MNRIFRYKDKVLYTDDFNLHICMDIMYRYVYIK